MALVLHASEDVGEVLMMLPRHRSLVLAGALLFCGTAGALADSPGGDGSLPALTSLTFDPATIIGGAQAATGTLTLSAPAPAGGIAVALQGDDTRLAVPASVTVPEGAAELRFVVPSTP